MRETLQLGGREYEHAGVGPVRHDLFIMHQARHAGIAGVVKDDGETTDAFADRLLASILASGRALLLLGAVLIPAGTKVEDWTEATAQATAEHLGKISDPAEKRKLYSELATVLLVFFRNGLASWIASARSSEDGAPATAQSRTTDSGSGADSSA